MKAMLMLSKKVKSGTKLEAWVKNVLFKGNGKQHEFETKEQYY